MSERRTLAPNQQFQMQQAMRKAARVSEAFARYEGMVQDLENAVAAQELEIGRLMTENEKLKTEAKKSAAAKGKASDA